MYKKDSPDADAITVVDEITVSRSQDSAIYIADTTIKSNPAIEAVILL